MWLNAISGESTKMIWACSARNVGTFVFVCATLALAQASGQGERAQPAARDVRSRQAGDSIQAIDDDYNRQLLELGRRRLEQLGRLASEQRPADAAVTYERLFRLAIADDLFRDAEEAAGKVIEQGTPSPATNALAYLVKIIALADRGAFDESLKSLRQAVNESAAERPATVARAALAPGEVIGICEGYYQRLVEANQFAIAREAFRLVLDQPNRPAVKDFLSARLKRIALVGKPAPPIQGTDLDGKEFNLAAQKGKVVLVVFWASWCQPNVSQVTWLEQVERAFHNKGLQVIGINVDNQEDGGQKLETVLPNIRRFLLDYNVPWPTLVNGTGDRDYAKAYGVSDIPANVLIGRDGTVVQIDLSTRNLEPVVSRLVGQ
jgi:thiol-disulfide isomerase/thioredoxin